jgi:DNA-binding IclR family transcriptional regulator
MINSILKAIDILEEFTHDYPSISLNELSKKLGYPKTTVHTILTTLESRGYIEKSNSRLYSIGTKIITLSQNARVNVQIRDRAAPLLRELSNHCRESIYLGVLDGDYCLNIYAIESPQRLLARTALGERAPLHCTSVGKAILAYLEQKKMEKIVENVGLPKFTTNTITDRTLLKNELERIRRAGFAVDSSEHEQNTYCLGAAIFDEYGTVIGSCSISSGDPELVNSRMAHLSICIRYTAQEISRLMGYIPTSKNRGQLINNPMFPDKSD